jgi:hypothetical protein
LVTLCLNRFPVPIHTRISLEVIIIIIIIRNSLLIWLHFVHAYCIVFICQVIFQCLWLCVLLYPSVLSATGPAKLRLHVNKCGWV